MRRVVIAEVQAELRRLLRLSSIRTSAAMLAHEIRNPLASIGLSAELLSDELGDRNEARQLCRAILDEVDRLLLITESALTEARSPRPDPTLQARVEGLCASLAQRSFLDRLLGR